MRKVGRNERCPCGSKKKYKKCHGRDEGPISVPEKNTVKHQTISFSIQNGPLSGLYEYVHSIPQFADPKDPRNEGGPEGLPGDYKVTFVLSRPGFPLHSEYGFFTEEILKGDSHLAITPPAYTPPTLPDANQLNFYLTTDQGSFKFKGIPNSAGYLGKIEIESLHAKSYEDAHLIAYRALAPSLSNWSVQMDIPLNIYQVDVVELRTDGRKMSMIIPFFAVPLASAPQGNITPSFRGYASLYREALISNNIAYQFLCFFKIIESILERRGRLGAEASRKKEKFYRPPERMPNDETLFSQWLNAVFNIRPPSWDEITLNAVFKSEVRGKKFGKIIDDKLRPLRVKIAHALSSESGELSLSVDETLHLHEISYWLPITKCIVRWMLKNEFPDEFLSHLDEKGEPRKILGAVNA